MVSQPTFVSHASSIWDAEETCDAFSFQKNPVVLLEVPSSSPFSSIRGCKSIARTNSMGSSHMTEVVFRKCLLLLVKENGSSEVDRVLICLIYYTGFTWIGEPCRDSDWRRPDGRVSVRSTCFGNKRYQWASRHLLGMFVLFLPTSPYFCGFLIVNVILEYIMNLTLHSYFRLSPIH